MTSGRTFRNALVASLVAMTVATIAAVLGWRLLEFDRALFLYAMALIASLGLTVYRFAIWAHRPPTKLLYLRALAMLRKPKSSPALLKHLGTRIVSYFALNSFVWRRGLTRWGAHWPIMVGCVMAMAVVVPLIFGWVWFESEPTDLHSYKVIAFGVHLRTIPVNGAEAFIAFHGLVWAAFFVVAGTSVALWRRLRDRGDQAAQTFGNDFAPLLILLAIAITGLLMTVSYSFLGGAFHAPLAKVHMFIVIGTLLWLPFSKLFHIPQRTLKLAHMIYEHESAAGSPAECARCGSEFADLRHVSDLISVQKELGYQYEMSGMANHYQMICPQCRRASLVIAQSQRWRQPNGV